MGANEEEKEEEEEEKEKKERESRKKWGRGLTQYDEKKIEKLPLPITTKKKYKKKLMHYLGY